MVNCIPETLEAVANAADNVEFIATRADGMDYHYELSPADARALAQEILKAADRCDGKTSDVYTFHTDSVAVLK